MTASPGLALQTAIVERLTNSTDLVTLLGGPRIFDSVPQGTALPYVVFARTVSVPWDSSDSLGDEHTVTLHVWSDAAGRRRVLEIIAAIRDALDDATPALTAHRLVNLACEFSEARREPDSDLYRGIVRYRAVTERTV